MNSFYGGKQGYSFVLVRNFATVQEMATEFAKGPAYKEVGFGEYVIINTVSKQDQDNGKIYRRSADYMGPQGGAVYIGSIVGPSGAAPMLKMESYQNVKGLQGTPTDKVLKGDGSLTVAGGDLVPGKTNTGEFNDTIEWTYTTLRDENGGETTVNLGFKVPFHVVEFTSVTTDAYGESLIERIDDKSHPFFSRWQISVPRGKKGDSLRSLRIIEANASIEDYPNKDTDIQQRRLVFVYDYTDYSNSLSGENKTIYLGAYNSIKDIRLAEDGTLTVDYTGADSKVFNKALKYIKSVSLNTDNGQLVVEYNQDTDAGGSPTRYEASLEWLNGLSIADNGAVTLNFVGGRTQQLDQKFKTVSSIEMDATGQITIAYNTGEQKIFSDKVKWITGASLSSAGAFKVDFNDDTSYSTTLKWVSNIEITSIGDVVVHYNDGQQEKKEKYIKVIKNVTVETESGGLGEGSGSQKIKVEYNTGDVETIGQPLNYVQDMAIDPSNFHLLARFSDPARRATLKAQHKTVNFNGLDDWLDLGSIKDESGILIGLNISQTEVPEITNQTIVIEYLNSTYPSGLQGENLRGKVVSAGNGGDKSFYAFDYSLQNGQFKKWYYLGGFQLNLSALFMVERRGAPGFEQKKQALSAQGLWFIVEDN